MRRNFTLVSVLLVITGITAAVLWLSVGLPAKASVPNAPDALQSIPSDFQFVAGINLQRIAASPLFLKLRQEQPQAARIGNDLARFTEQTGIDPFRDITYVVLAGRADGTAKRESLIIVSGAFDKSRITDIIRTKASAIEMDYRGTPLMLIPEPKDSTVKNGMVFLAEREIAIGNLASIKSALDTRAGDKNDILSNATISSLLGGIDLNEMLWFAGNAADALKIAPMQAPPALNASSVQGIAGTLNISENLAGKIIATAIDANAATKMADVFRGIIALGQLSEKQNPDLSLLLSTFTVTQNASQISLSFNIPGELLKRLGRARVAPAGAI